MQLAGRFVSLTSHHAPAKKNDSILLSGTILTFKCYICTLRQGDHCLWVHHCIRPLLHDMKSFNQLLMSKY